MTYKRDCTLPTEFLEQLTEQGLEGLPELIRILVNEAMLLERERHLQARPYERTAQRRDYANGFKPKTVKTRQGEITFEVPQVRKSDFYPAALEKGLRSERALMLTIAEMYVQGVSTRKVAAITEELIGTSVSSTQVSRAAKLLDEELAAWRERPLGEMVYLVLDARYEHVRQDGQVRDAAVLMASGVDLAGKRSILGVSVSLSEAEPHWRTFLQALVARGLCGVKLIISDDHAGLKQARQAVFGGVPWQRCIFHLQQNAAAHVPRKSMRRQVAQDLKAVFDAPDRASAEQYLKRVIEKYQPVASHLAEWMEHNVPQGLTFFSFPSQHWRRIRTSNNLERVSQEIKRRTRVVRIFPNPASCLRLVSAILMETSEAWETGKVYLSMEPD